MYLNRGRLYHMDIFVMAVMNQLAARTGSPHECACAYHNTTMPGSAPVGQSSFEKHLVKWDQARAVSQGDAWVIVQRCNRSNKLVCLVVGHVVCAGSRRETSKNDARRGAEPHEKSAAISGKGRL